MFVLGLLTCIALRAFSAQAKVVETFDECKNFFYKDTEPGGMDQNAKKICQKLDDGTTTMVYGDDDIYHHAYYYGTLYSVYHKIPLYSAYRLEPSCSDTTGRTNKWHLEPQFHPVEDHIHHAGMDGLLRNCGTGCRVDDVFTVDDLVDSISADTSGLRCGHVQISEPNSPINYMVPENKNNQDTYKGKQAISSDYSDTGYDRGHLNPNSFQCDEGRTATFTLTNAAPMDACFNRIQWKNWESTLKSFLREKLDSDRGTAYIVTGTVPDANKRIPQREKPEDSNRVTVPSHIWTAVCYKHNDNDKSVSFGYIGENLPGGRISLMSVSQMNIRLSKLYELSNTQKSIKIFDNCFEDNEKLNEVRNAFKKLINLPLNQRVQLTPDVQNKYHAFQSISTDNLSPGENVEVTELSVKLTFNSLSAYSTVAEELKDFAESYCLITNSRHDTVECQLGSKKRKIAADGSQCSIISNSGSGCQCNTGGETKRCCSTPCLYQDNLKGHRCYSGQKEIACSPPYSLITYKGERCKDDHPCGTYGQDYYWCNKISGSWDYCSPPLWKSKAINGKYCLNNNACAKYGESQQWCYTDDGNKHECCTSNDCFSTVSGKTCKSDHPCDKHGEDYLWCYTTDGSWDKCCTNCSK